MPLSQVNPSIYGQQLAKKQSNIRQQFQQFCAPPLEVFSSEPEHYRVRAEFRVWHQDSDTFYAMFRKDDPKRPHRIDRFPIGAQKINTLMTELMKHIQSSNELRQRLFQIEFLTTLSGQALVTMIYHKVLDSQWEQQARQLEEQLHAHIIGRSKKQRLVLSSDYVTETLTVENKAYQFQQIENSFTQPNAGVNQKMLSWVLKNSKNNGGDLVELYCGNGNFTVVLAQNFKKVLATEISKTSVKSAHYNLALNGIHNVAIARMSSEEFTQALQGNREFRRLKDIDLNSFNFSTILVDPPRAGLDNATEELVSRFDNIIYISCNPNTLHKNLLTITKTHQIQHFALFDQFPYTDHIECAVSLIKRQSTEEHRP
jgi:tRNA (uracil-5-)-methyltransferase